MIGFYNYTVILTYIGAAAGFAGITFAADGDIKGALICLMLAGFCDMFDGKIASTMQRTRPEKRFGIQIDSLSDLVCFGVLPALIVWRCAGGSTVHTLIGAAYMLCALIRLAWFNVDEEERQDREEGGRKTYLGLPVTTSALLLPLFVGSARLLDLPVETIAPWLLAVIAAAFITPFRLKKPGAAGKIALLVCGAAALTVVILGVMV